MITCIKCNKSFKYPWLLKRHLNRKVACYTSDITDENNEIEPKTSQKTQSTQSTQATQQEVSIKQENSRIFVV